MITISMKSCLKNYWLFNILFSKFKNIFFSQAIYNLQLLGKLYLGKEN